MSIEMKILYINIKETVQNTIGSCHLSFRVIILMMECISALASKYKNKNGARHLLDGNRVLGLNMQPQSGFLGFGYKGLFKHVFGKWDMDLSCICTGDQNLYLIIMAQVNETELVVKDKTFYRTGLKALSLNPWH